MTETEQVLHIHRRRHVEFDLESLGIVAVVLTARPVFHIDFFEGLHSVPSFPNPAGTRPDFLAFAKQTLFMRTNARNSKY